MWGSMDKMNCFYTINLGALFGCVFVFLFLVSLGGLFFGRRFSKKKSGIDKEVSDFIPSTILGLLSLIMGFTFSMSISRLEHRKELVLREANAIGTVYLRSGLLNSEHTQAVRNLLKQYVDTRLDFFSVGVDFTQIEKTEERARSIQNKLWEYVTQVTRKDRSAVQGLFVASVNDLIDLQAERFFALQNTVPTVVYWVILLLASIGLSSRFFIRGMRGQGGCAGAALLAILFGLVFALIHDLDRPRSGLTTVSQEAMSSFQKSLSD